MKEPNIRLRALELEDLDFLYQIENDDRLWELGVSNVPYSRRVLLDYITSASADIYLSETKKRLKCCNLLDLRGIMS